MTRLPRPRRSVLAAFALCFGISALLTSCSNEPLPRDTPSIDELAIGILSGRRANPFAADTPAAPDSAGKTGAWEGQWLVGGHLLSLTAKHMAAGQTEDKAYLFGYSIRARHHFMLVVTAGGSAPDKVDVYWFTIKGKVWQFEPLQDSAGKVADKRIVWNTQQPVATYESYEATGPDAWRPPAARPELALLRGWVGKWPNNRTDQGVNQQPATVTGAFNASMTGNGYFLVWYSTENIKFQNGTSRNDRLVELWGFTDVNHQYFRVDIGTNVEGRAITPVLAYSAMFTDGGNGALVLLAPLNKMGTGPTAISTRYFIGLTAPDTITLVEQYLKGGITWTDSPNGIAKWARVH